MGQGQSNDLNENAVPVEAPPACFQTRLDFDKILDATLDENVWMDFKERFDKRVIEREDLDKVREMQVFEVSWKLAQEQTRRNSRTASKAYWTRLPRVLELIGPHIKTLILRMDDSDVSVVRDGIRPMKMDFLMRLPQLVPNLDALKFSRVCLEGCSDEQCSLLLSKVKDMKMGLKTLSVDEESSMGLIGALLAVLIRSGGSTLCYLDVPADLIPLEDDDDNSSLVFPWLTYLSLTDFGCSITQEESFPNWICKLFPNLMTLEIRENSYGPGPEFMKFVDAVVATFPLLTLVVRPLISDNMDPNGPKITRIQKLVIDVTRESMTALKVLAHVTTVDVLEVRGSVRSGLSQERIQTEVNKLNAQVGRVEFTD